MTGTRTTLGARWGLIAGLVLGGGGAPGFAWGQSETKTEIETETEIASSSGDTTSHFIAERAEVRLFLNFGSASTIEGVGDAEVFAAFADVFRTRTGLVVRRAGDAWRECLTPERSEAFLECLDSKIEPDSLPSLAMFLAVVPSRRRSGARVAVTVFDPAAVKAAISELEAAKGSALLPEEREGRVDLLSQRVSEDGLKGADEIRAFADKILTGQFQRFVSAHPPLGTVRVELPQPGVLYWNRSATGLPAATVTLLSDVPVGVYDLKIELVNYETVTTQVELVSPKEILIRPEMIRKLTSTGVVLNRSTFWGGVGVAAAGAVLLGVGLANRPNLNCIDRECDTGLSRQTGARFFDEDPQLGVPFIPLGYSLMGTGLIWSAGTWMQSERGDEIPWLPFVVGLVAGGTSLSLSIVLDR